MSSAQVMVLASTMYSHIRSVLSLFIGCKGNKIPANSQVLAGKIASYFISSSICHLTTTFLPSMM